MALEGKAKAAKKRAAKKSPRRAPKGGELLEAKFGSGKLRSAAFMPRQATMSKIPHTGLDAVEAVEGGVPTKVVRQFKDELGVSQEYMARLMGVKVRTFKEHLKKDRLNLNESDRLIRIVQVMEQARRAFNGNDELASKWMASEIRALGGRRPLDLLSTGTGTRLVEAVLTRVEHGMYS